MSDDQQRITKTLETKLQVDDGAREVLARISTTSVDRDGDVMMPSGVDLSDYRKNPVVLFGHRSDQIPVAKATKIEQTPQALLAKIAFAVRPASLPDVQEWVPDTLLSLFQQKVLSAFSVGFMIDDSREPDNKDRRRFGDGVRRIITKWRLLEFSIVPVPSNQDALVMAVSKGAVSSGSWTYAELTDDFAALEYDVPQPFRIELEKPEPFRARLPA